MSDTIIAVCAHCGHQYIIGRTGTVMGCDECLGVIRNFEGMIIDEEYNFVTEEDELTDMEKA